MQEQEEINEIILRLGLTAHPEGGHYRETYRHHDPAGGRGAVTAIYYLLRAGERSAWHRIDAVEVWHHYAGDPLRLSIAVEGTDIESHVLGKNFAAGEVAHVAVPLGAWQSAESLGAWTLLGCTVAPAFTFEGFELAPGDEAIG